jgi:hypothetical protein
MHVWGLSYPHSLTHNMFALRLAMLGSMTLQQPKPAAMTVVALKT